MSTSRGGLFIAIFTEGSTRVFMLVTFNEQNKTDILIVIQKCLNRSKFVPWRIAPFASSSSHFEKLIPLLPRLIPRG